MATDSSNQPAVDTTRSSAISKTRLVWTLGLLTAFAVCALLSWATRDAVSRIRELKREGKANSARLSREGPVDLRPWQTARALAALAPTPEEAELAREAERLADHEVDQAFASALRQASAQKRVLTGESRQLAQRLGEIQKLVIEDQARVQKLTGSAKAGGSPGARRGGGADLLDDDLDVAKAQLGLDSDELTDAQADLARSVGDERNKIQQQLAEHESAMHQYDAQVAKAGSAANAPAERYDSLLTALTALLGQRNRLAELQRATREAQTDAATLTSQHDQLEKQANARTTADVAPAGTQTKGGAESPADKTAAIASLNDRAAQRQLLSILDDRIQTEQQVAAVYNKWSVQVLAQHDVALHVLLRFLAWIALILLCAVLVETALLRIVDRPSLDRRRMRTLRTLFKIGIQAAGVLLIAIVIFGTPSHMPTIIGFTTAGITVVLQDFILAFLGWFVLMGKNGIGVGDWVEINGIGGEVVETGLMRTVLLETGNWSDKGRPTGRRITLMNSFAIKGQYFNFSTTGQWMWDEITLTIPRAEDAYVQIEHIHQVVVEETEKDARLAEQEWKRVARQKDSAELPVGPSIDVRPGLYGIDIVVRYVTRAAERFAVRNRLYQRVIGLLQKSSLPSASHSTPTI